MPAGPRSRNAAPSAAGHTSTAGSGTVAAPGRARKSAALADGGSGAGQ
ncbi:hypothetical protein [Streptomyces sp. NPDC051135]